MKKTPKLKNSKTQKLSQEETGHVAALAKLRLTPQETIKFQKQLSEILDYVEVLKKLKTEKVEPTSQVTGLENVSREDRVGESLTQAETLSGAKEKYQGRFKIKAIFE
jgi:aspartyl-tRNA(Asn)/glutamyl-tRNA(Gln) amidotransferase subunit C